MNDFYKCIQDYKQKVDDYNKLKNEVIIIEKNLLEKKKNLLLRLNKFNCKNSQELKIKLETLKSQIDESSLIIQQQLNALSHNIERLKGQKDIIETELNNYQDKLIIAEKNRDIYEKTIEFLTKLSETLRIETINKIETLVTQAINKIFDNNYQFKIYMSNRNDLPNLIFKLEDNKNSLDIIDSFGGGIADIIAIVLRLIILELQIPKNEGPVILDEVGKFLSVDYQHKFGEFLKEWSNKFNRQIILISHKTELLPYANKIFKISKINNISKIESIDSRN